MGNPIALIEESRSNTVTRGNIYCNCFEHFAKNRFSFTKPLFTEP